MKRRSGHFKSSVSLWQPAHRSDWMSFNARRTWQTLPFADDGNGSEVGKQNWCARCRKGQSRNQRHLYEIWKWRLGGWLEIVKNANQAKCCNPILTKILKFWTISNVIKFCALKQTCDLLSSSSFSPTLNSHLLQFSFDFTANSSGYVAKRARKIFPFFFYFHVKCILLFT